MPYSQRTQRMIDSAPDYYQYAQSYHEVQKAIAEDYDQVQIDNDDLKKQLYIPTATWGLKYWEETLKIPVVESDSYPIRRSRVLSKWRGFGNFSAGLIKSVCEAFINGEVSVKIRVPQQEVVITFIGKRGVPPNLSDLEAQVENIVLAHLGIAYKFSYLVWEELERAAVTWDRVETENDTGLTWDEFEVWKP